MAKEPCGYNYGYRPENRETLLDNKMGPINLHEPLKTETFYGWNDTWKRRQKRCSRRVGQQDEKHENTFLCHF